MSAEHPAAQDRLPNPATDTPLATKSAAQTWREKDRVSITGEDFNGEHGLIAWVDLDAEKVGVWIAGFETGDMPITFRFSEIERRERRAR